jgi:purine catabolism regulator
MTPDDLLEYAEGLARVSASGGGPTALAAYLATDTGAGVLLEDAEWRHVAAAGKRQLPPSARGADGAAMRTLVVAAGNAAYGYLSIFGDSPQALEATIARARLTASAIAVEFARDGGGARGRRRTFWERLIDGAYHDAGLAREDAVARGVTLANHYVCVALEAEPAGDELAGFVSDTLRSGQNELGLVERGAVLFAIVPATREVDAANARTAATLLPKTAAKRMPHLRVSGGIAMPVTLLEVARGVEQAEAALAITKRLYGPGRVMAYDELGAYPLLYAGGSAEELRAFARSVLSPLREYDEKHATELERTLRCYFDCGQNVKTAAEELHVHRHTVFYRLRQIGDISGRSLNSPHDQLTLRLAIAIDTLER